MSTERKKYIRPTVKKWLAPSKDISFLSSSQLDIKGDLFKKAIANVKPGREVELRYGFFTEGKFDHNIPRETWIKYLVFLRKLPKAYKEEKIQKYYSHKYDDNIRIVENLLENVPHKTQYKNRLENDQFYKENNLYIRMSISEEKDLESKESKESKEYRYITRISFTRSNIRIDLSHTIYYGSDIKPDYQIELEFLSSDVDIKIVSESIQLFKLVAQIFSPVAEKNTVYNHYSKLFPEAQDKTFYYFYTKAWAKPIDLTHFRLKDLDSEKNYSVTNKLDGERYILLFDTADIYLLNSKHVLKVMNNDTNIKGTVADVELFKNEIHAFDILIHNYTDVRVSHFDTRLKILNEIHAIFPLMKVKTFYMTGNLFNDTKTVLDNLSDNDDGLIYTPINDVYNSPRIFKWKPEDKLTIDFRLHQDSQDETKYGLYVLTKGEHKNKDHLFVKDEFNGYISLNKSQYEDNSIVEFKWENNTFVPYRLRKDKTQPNFITVANDVWNLMGNPVTKKELLDFLKSVKTRNINNDKKDPLIILRKNHNIIKQNLIANYCKGKGILDLGIGNGGDLLKYWKTGISFLDGIDINNNAIKKATDRLKETKDISFSNRVKLYTIPITKLTLDKNFHGKQYDVITSFFSLTFLFEKRNEIVDFIKLLNLHLKEDGYFIGTVMDGKSTHEALKNTPVDGKLDFGNNIIITRKYRDYKPLGSMIHIQLEAVSIQEQNEWLVDFDLLTSYLRQIGIELVQSSLFEKSNYSLDNFSTLNRQFVFKRVQKDSLPVLSSKPKDLPYAELNKMIVFNSPIIKSGNLVRMGSITDGNCLFSSFLLATIPHTQNLSEDEQRNYSIMFRQTCATKLTPEIWKNLGNGSVSRLGWMNLKGESIPAFDILSQNEIKKKAASKQGSKYISHNDVDAIFANIQSDKKLADLKIDQLKPIIKQKILDKYNEKKLNTIIQQENKQIDISKQIDGALDLAENKAFDDYKKLVFNPGEYVGEEVISLLSYITKTNVLILSLETRLPYKKGQIFNPEWQTVLILHIRRHFEPIFLYTKDKQLLRVFSSDNEILIPFLSE